MTDEEKAEEYAIAVCFNCKKNISKNACNRENYENCCNYVNSYLGFYHGYKAGLLDREQENAELKEQNKDLCESLDIMNNRESDLLEQIEKLKNLYKEGIPEDKDRLCIFFDGEYYIDTFNNLSSSEQKQLIKWCYLPKITER